MRMNMEMRVNIEDTPIIVRAKTTITHKEPDPLLALK
jgi:hypothetical protein